MCSASAEPSTSGSPAPDTLCCRPAERGLTPGRGTGLLFVTPPAGAGDVGRYVGPAPLVVPVVVRSEELGCLHCVPGRQALPTAVNSSTRPFTSAFFPLAAFQLSATFSSPAQVGLQASRRWPERSEFSRRIEWPVGSPTTPLVPKNFPRLGASQYLFFFSPSLFKNFSEQ